MVIALSRRYSRPTLHWPAAASTFPAFHVPVFLPLDAFRLFLRAWIQRFRRTACNGTWTFITTLFTHPQIPLPSGYCLSTAATFIPVHSEFRQYLVHSGHGHPTPGIQAAPSISGQLSCLRLTAASCRLHRAYKLNREPLQAPRYSEYQGGASGRYSLISPLEYQFSGTSVPCASFSLTNVSHDCRCRNLPEG